jgi:hypothetical protein
MIIEDKNGDLICDGKCNDDCDGNIIWKCRCDCGNEIEVSGCDLINDRVASCGECEN